MEGKAMVVTMSRDIAARLYEAIRTLRPDWHDIDDERGAMKVIVTGTNDDPEPVRNHVRTKAARKRLAERFKAPHDDLRLVIVCDMWLTGFDCPPAHTMYLDKPLAGHNLMQAIARVNRVYGDKPGGLIVDLLGLGRPVGRCARDLHPGRRHGRGRQEGAERGCTCHAGGLRETTWLLPRVRLRAGARRQTASRAAGVSTRDRSRLWAE